MRSISRSRNHPPAERLARVKRDKALNFVRHIDVRPLQRHSAFVERQTIECRPIRRRECLELIERVFLLEHLGVAFQRIRRIEQARATASRFLRLAGVRSAVGTEEIFGRA